MSADLVAELETVVARLDPAWRADTQRALDRLRTRGARSRDDLCAIARDPRAAAEDRRTACWALARLEHEEAAGTLLEILADDDPELRATAARSLGELGAESAGQRLLERLRADPDLEVRRAAAYSLGLIGYAGAVAEMARVLGAADEPPPLRGMVAEALADIADPDAVAALLAALADPSPEVRYWAAYALGRLGSGAVIPQLERLAGDDSEVPGFGTVSAEAARAIASIRAREAAAERT